MKELTERQQEVFDATCKFIEEKRYPPTIKELADIFGVFHNAISEHITALVKKGYMERDYDVARGLRVKTDSTDREEALELEIASLKGQLITAKCIHLTGREVVDAGNFLGLQNDPLELEKEILEGEITISLCPSGGLLVVGDGTFVHSKYVVNMTDYPEEGYIPLGETTTRGISVNFTEGFKKAQQKRKENNLNGLTEEINFDVKSMKINPIK